MLSKEIINEKKEKYSNQWEITSSEYNNKEVYSWMASFLDDDQHVILEIGCGSGISTLHLCNKAKVVISIDDNLKCLEKAKEYLESKGIKVKLIKRESIVVRNYMEYEASYTKIKKKSFNDEQVILIEGDILYDVNLLNFLKAYKRFDTVVCWLIGTHQAKMNNDKIQQDNIDSDGKYRWCVEEMICKLCKNILKLGGLIHIIDRIKEPTNEEQKQSFIDSYKELFSYNIEFKGMDLKTVLLENYNGIMMVNTVGSTTKIIDNKSLTMTFASFLFQKKQ